MIGRFIWERGSKPTLDGVPLRAQSLRIDADSKETVVTLGVRVDVEHLDIPDAKVRVEEEVRQTLVALGWTPPPETTP